MPAPRRPVQDLGENDHDLLTFSEAGGRLQNEIARAAAVVADLERAGDAGGLERAQKRLAALEEAARRISDSRITGARFERFFGYPASPSGDAP